MFGEGFKIAMTSLVSGRLGIACSCIGAADRLLEMSIAHAKQRSTFGAPLAERQAIQWMLADSATELALARTLTYETLRGGRLSEWMSRIGSGASMAKTVTVQRWRDALLTEPWQIHGGSGVVSGFPCRTFFSEI